MISRRETLLSLGALGSIAFAPRAAHADLMKLEAAARQEGALTWYIAQFDAERAEALGRAFTREYPGITVSVIRTTGQVAFQRLLMDIKNHTPQCDVFGATDISHMPLLKERHELEDFTPEHAAGLLPAFARVSDPGHYYITNVSRHLLIYNTQKVPAAEAPKAWTDFLDPKWKGQVAMGHPAFSGCMGTLVVTLKHMYGWEFFEKLAKNNPRIGRSLADPVTLVTAGECMVGVAAATGANTGPT